jgi:hypothetical protein
MIRSNRGRLGAADSMIFASLPRTISVVSYFRALTSPAEPFSRTRRIFSKTARNLGRQSHLSAKRRAFLFSIARLHDDSRLDMSAKTRSFDFVPHSLPAAPVKTLRPLRRFTPPRNLAIP